MRMRITRGSLQLGDAPPRRNYGRDTGQVDGPPAFALALRRIAEEVAQPAFDADPPGEVAPRQRADPLPDIARKITEHELRHPPHVARRQQVDPELRHRVNAIDAGA